MADTMGSTEAFFFRTILKNCFAAFSARGTAMLITNTKIITSALGIIIVFFCVAHTLPKNMI